ncbi:MAG: S-adenosylmethionine decarboxylase [Alphaproteobacteria bacterium]|nr:S-adenosylmethionine decarboxylase [Alphaproteobacteria bacterium]
MLGWHWLAHTEQGAAAVLGEPGRLETLLLDLASTLDLTPVAPPLVRPVAGGLAGVLLLAESHAAVHVDLGAGAAMIDVFSCRAIDGAQAAARVAAALGAAPSWELRSRGVLPAGASA